MGQPSASLQVITDKLLILRSQILGQLKVAGFIRPHGAGDIKDLNMSNSNNLAVVKVRVPVPFGFFFFQQSFDFLLKPLLQRLAFLHTNCITEEIVHCPFFVFCHQNNILGSVNNNINIIVVIF